MDRKQNQMEQQNAMTVGAFEMISKGLIGALGGWVGVQVLNATNASFRALPHAPIKVALITMAAIGTGGFFSERKVSNLAVENNNRRFGTAPTEHSEWVDLFHDHKIQAVGLLWAGSIAMSLRRGDMSMPFYQRLIDARIFAQWMTVGSAISLGVLITVFPDNRSQQRFIVDGSAADRALVKAYEDQKAIALKQAAARDAKKKALHDDHAAAVAAVTSDTSLAASKQL
jgi:hypothetical protein